MESFRRKGGLLHGWGVLHGVGEAPCAAWLEVRGNAAINEQRISAMLGKAVRNVECGQVNIDLVMYGALAAEPAQDSMFLVLEWPDAEQLRLPLPLPSRLRGGRGSARLLALPWKHYFSRGIRLIRQGQVKVLLGKAARMMLAYFFSGWSPVRLLQWAEAEGAPLALVIDHDLGGGANLYRHSLMVRLVEEGVLPILLTAHHGMLVFQLEAKRGRRTQTAHVEKLDELFDALSGANISRIIFNNILSFPRPLLFVATLSNWLRQKDGKQFLFLVHDHYCICPAWLLLNDAGQYCGVPDAAVCADCLPANKALFLEFADGVDIVSWRVVWGGLMQEATEIRCFSRATRNLLLRAHPEISPGRVSVVPHTLDHVRLRKVALKDAGAPVIGVIGHIGYHKGGKVVQDLAHYILANGKKARIVLIGTTEFDLPKEVVLITGPYRPEQLPGLMEAHGVNIGFFPSISPETFSYVTEEMIMMGVPVLAFDLGAPGERVAQYAYGRVIAFCDPEGVFNAINDHYEDCVRCL